MSSYYVFLAQVDIRLKQSLGIRYVDHVVCNGEVRNAHGILVRKPEAHNET